MNKTAIKNFAIWARNKLIAEITYKAGLLGIDSNGIKAALPQSGNGIEYYDIGSKEPYAISGTQIKQRQDLVEAIQAKQAGSDYKSAYAQVIDEVAYTWFNRLIAIRFMEVNDYLPSRIRVLSSVSGKNEPDIVTTPFEAQMDYTAAETEQITSWKHKEELDEAFRYLFLKQCNELSGMLPALFEKVSDYTELLLTISFTDKDGVIYHLVTDIPEKDFDVINPDEKGNVTGQVEIIGWLYQYYNTEPKAKVFARASGSKIKKEEIPAATQLFTPDWIVRYMVENSLGRIFSEQWAVDSDQKAVVSGQWPEKCPVDNEQWAEIEKKRARKEQKIADGFGWKYYLAEAPQSYEVRRQLVTDHSSLTTDFHIEDVKVIDPCMGSGHILCYFFDVLMQIYESQGYTQRDAAQSILENNIWGLDIDDRAYQLAYFAVMMKARQYDRRILSRGIQPHVYAIVESNGFNKAQLKYFGATLNDSDRSKALAQVNTLLEQLYDAKEYGSILTVDQMDWNLLREFSDEWAVDSGQSSDQWAVDSGQSSDQWAVASGESSDQWAVASGESSDEWAVASGQLSLDMIGIEKTQKWLKRLIDVGEALAQKYLATCTNPPYMGGSGMDGKLSAYVKKNYPDSKSDLFAVFVERCGEMTKKNGYYAMITQHAWMFLSSFERLRKKLQKVDTINMAHLGARAFDEISGEVVQTTSFVMRKSHTLGYTGKYLRLIDGKSEKEKQEAFLSTDHCPLFTAQQENFSKIPGVPVAYWINKNWFCIFDSYPALRDYVTLKKGTSTGDNARFIRNWFEVDITTIFFSATTPEEAESSNMKWFPINGGGERRKWFGNRTDVVNWKNDGSEMKALATKLNHGGHWSRYIVNPDRFFTEAIGWSAISSSKISVRYIGFGFAFSSAAMEAFDNNLKYVMALLNSIVAEDILHLLAPTINFGVEQIGKIPVVIGKKDAIEKLVDECINTAKNDWDSFETSWNFQRHPLVSDQYLVVSDQNTAHCTLPTDHCTAHCSLLSDHYKAWAQQCDQRFAQLKANEEELNRIFIDIYGLQDELTPEVEDKDVTVRKADLQRDIKSLLSYAVGCMFGRYSLDVEGLAYAGGCFSDQWVRISGQRSVASGQNTDHCSLTTDHYYRREVVEYYVSKELSGTLGMAESNAGCGRDISACEDAAKGRVICFVGSDAEGSSINPFQYRRGTSAKLYEGICELPFDCKGIDGGTGDPVYDLCSPEILAAITSGTCTELVQRGWENAQRIDWQAVHCSLTTDHFSPDKDGVIPLTDEEYFEDDIIGLLCKWLKLVYGEKTLEKNLNFIAHALTTGHSSLTTKSSREVIRNYFLNDFFKDHCSTYSVTGSGKRPIYWLYDSGKQNGFKALIYLHRYDADTTGRVRAFYLHRMEKIYISEIDRMTDTVENSKNNREVAKATKRREKLRRQLKECQEYDERIAHLALARIEIDLDDGVKVNYRKVQTDKKGKFYEVLADSKNIMSKK